jgi:hypothetical protein
MIEKERSDREKQASDMDDFFRYRAENVTLHTC